MWPRIALIVGVLAVLAGGGWYIERLHRKIETAEHNEKVAKDAAEKNLKALDQALDFQRQLAVIEGKVDQIKADQANASTQFNRAIAGARATTLARPADQSAAAAYAERLRAARAGAAGGTPSVGSPASPPLLPQPPAGPAAKSR